LAFKACFLRTTGVDLTPAPYYSEPGITIYLGDAREIARYLTYDLVITDPPYGISHPTAYKARGRSKLASCRDYPPVAGDGAPFDPAPWIDRPSVLFGANYFADRLPSASGWLVWDKQRPHTLDQATAELAWTNFVKGVRVFRHLWHGCMRASREPLVHPTQKPTALMQWVLGLKWTPPGVVLDPFMGSGSTLKAAKLEGREAIGVEMSEAYCEAAAKALSALDVERT